VTTAERTGRCFGEFCRPRLGITRTKHFCEAVDYNSGATAETLWRAAMSYDIYDPPSGRSRRWAHRRKPQPSVPRWVAIFVVIVCGTMAGTIAWEKVARFVRPGSKSAAAGMVAATSSAQPARAEWQGDTANALEEAVREVNAGNITQAEVAMDRAAALVSGARMKSESAAATFFGTSVRQLDRIAAVHPESERLGEHGALMRIELAQLRSSLETAPGEAGKVGRVAIAAPRAIGRDTMLDAKSLGGKILDATMMPKSAEILEPPSSRLFVDNVRVENLTLEGAAQTLDGMHWKNVTFIGTRLRYEGGEVDLQNVRFVRCMFGFTTDERGVRLANTIALGESSIVIE